MDPSPSPSSPSSSPSPSPSSSPSLFALLLSHRDIVCSEHGKERHEKEGRKSRKKSSKSSPLVSTSTAQLSFLKNVDTLRLSGKVANSDSAPQADISRPVQSVEDGGSNVREGTFAREQGSVNNVDVTERPLSAQRQESSELEEDEEKTQERSASLLHTAGEERCYSLRFVGLMYGISDEFVLTCAGQSASRHSCSKAMVSIFLALLCLLNMIPHFCRVITAQSAEDTPGSGVYNNASDIST